VVYVNIVDDTKVIGTFDTLCCVVANGHRGENTWPRPHTHKHTYLLEREKNSSCVRVVNEASGIQEGENKVNEGGKRSGFQYAHVTCSTSTLLDWLLFLLLSMYYYVLLSHLSSIIWII
jgi:hypothetical protein